AGKWILGLVFAGIHAFLLIYSVNGNQLRGSPFKLLTPTLIFLFYWVSLPILHHHPLFSAIPVIVHLILDFIELNPFDLSYQWPFKLDSVTVPNPFGILSAAGSLATYPSTTIKIPLPQWPIRFEMNSNPSSTTGNGSGRPGIPIGKLSAFMRNQNI